MKKKILICGATGFIGRNLIEDLSRNKNMIKETNQNSGQGWVK